MAQITKKKEAPGTEIEVLTISQGRIEFCILGLTPLILNRVSQKAKRELLLPRGRLSATDKKTNLKHDPYAEFRDAPYLDPDPKAPTLIRHLAVAFKKALASVAIDMPGAAKAQIGRLTYVPQDYIGVYGLPKLLMSIVRSADMNKTPDIRSRCILPEWACRLNVTFVRPLMTDQIVANLLAAAGIMRGTGDWRPEKGAGSYGQFELVGADDPRFLALVKSGGRGPQQAAMEKPACYDAETAELLSWYLDEVADRQKKRGDIKAGSDG